MARLSRWLRRTLVGLGSTVGGLILIILVSLLIPGCSVGYVTRQSMTHLHVLSARQSVDKAIKKGKIPDQWQPKLEVIAEARDFGDDELELPAKDLYRKISLAHPDPNWVVTASAPTINGSGVRSPFRCRPATSRLRRPAIAEQRR